MASRRRKIGLHTTFEEIQRRINEDVYRERGDERLGSSLFANTSGEPPVSSIGEPEPEAGGPAEPEEPSETEAEEPLPRPEMKYPILQSTAPYPYGAKRPDLIPAFYGRGPGQSTRVYAMQWIPTRVKDTYVFGDIFVAFARPSKVAGSSLVLFREKTLATWTVFSSATSLGRAVERLGSPSSHGPSDYENYKELHPDFSGEWIFDDDKLKLWMSVRPNNSHSGPRKPRTVEGKLGALGGELEARGFDYKYFTSGDDDDE
jgi:hypothetical protein